jgi:hypothetical protein
MSSNGGGSSGQPRFSPGRGNRGGWRKVDKGIADGGGETVPPRCTADRTKSVSWREKRCSRGHRRREHRRMAQPRHMPQAGARDGCRIGQWLIATAIAII